MESHQNTSNLKVYANDVEPVTPSMDITPTEVCHADIELGDREDSPKNPGKEVAEFGEGEDDDEDLFEGSTHGFLVYHSQNQSTSKLVVSIFVILVQLMLYSVILKDALGGISGDEFTIPVKVRFGRSCGESSNLVCPPELPNLGYTSLAGCILAFFLMHDMIAGFRILCSVPGCWAKLGGLIVLTEAFMAALAGTLFALSANEGYDAIANCIGVLFIHDVDEKAFEAFKAIKFDKLCKLKKNCCAKLGRPHSVIFIAIFAVLVFTISMASVVRQVQLDNIRAEYGDDFTDEFFSSPGGYTYDWSDGADYDGTSHWSSVANDHDDSNGGGSDIDTDSDYHGDSDSDYHGDSDSDYHGNSDSDYHGGSDSDHFADSDFGGADSDHGGYSDYGGRRRLVTGKDSSN